MNNVATTPAARFAAHAGWSHARHSAISLLRERARIAAVLADLPASWGQVRKVLNELQAIVG